MRRGGATDPTGRAFAAWLSDALGQQVVVDNRPGAGATIGHGLVAKAAPDGYTILLGTSAGLAVSPAFGTKLPYDPVKDFAPIGLGVYAPFALVLYPGVPANSTKEFIELARTQPGKLNCASPGTGTPNHLGCELLHALTGIRTVHVPFKGGGPAVVDLVAGRVHYMFSSIPAVDPHLKSGRLKVIAVGHPTRTRVMPEAPPVAEVLPGFNNTTWYGLLAPAGTPKAIVNQLNGEMKKAVDNAAFSQRLLAIGLEAASNSPAEFHEMIQAELKRWTKVIKEAGITAESAQ
ncbi:MAG: Bug family tripartite tricarboxylate transporter substrate binding protein [Burkholderiales bacterium]